jgi:4-aminobutyrate aminotransferase-like enzyme
VCVYVCVCVCMCVFSGVNVGMCGAVALRLRPTLTVQRKHVDVFLEALNDVLKDLK